MLSEREKWLMLQSWSQGRDEWDRWIADHEEHLAKEAPPPVQSQGSPPADCKRCEKCGGRDIHTKWVEEGEYVCPLNNGHAKKTYKMECYDKDFLRHHCRTCSFEWDTDVEPPADCKCDCESAGKIPQLEQELQGMRAKLARVKDWGNDAIYHGTDIVRWSDFLNILSDEPEVLAVVEGHYGDDMWWEDVDGDKTLTICSRPFDKSTPATVIVLRDKGRG
jgi:hypothetical protein